MPRTVAAVSIASTLIFLSAWVFLSPDVTNAQASAPQANASSNKECPAPDATDKYAGESEGKTYTIPDPSDSEKTITITNLSKKSCTQPCPPGSAIPSLSGLCHAESDCVIDKTTGKTCENKTPALPSNLGNTGGGTAGGSPTITPDTTPTPSPPPPAPPVAPSPTPASPTEGQSLLQQLFNPNSLSKNEDLIPNTGTNPTGLFSPQTNLGLQGGLSPELNPNPAAVPTVNNQFGGNSGSPVGTYPGALGNTFGPSPDNTTLINEAGQFNPGSGASQDQSCASFVCSAGKAVSSAWNTVTDTVGNAVGNVANAVGNLFGGECGTTCQIMKGVENAQGPLPEGSIQVAENTGGTVTDAGVLGTQENAGVPEAAIIRDENGNIIGYDWSKIETTNYLPAKDVPSAPPTPLPETSGPLAPGENGVNPNAIEKYLPPPPEPAPPDFSDIVLDNHPVVQGPVQPQPSDQNPSDKASPQAPEPQPDQKTTEPIPNAAPGPINQEGPTPGLGKDQTNQPGSANPDHVQQEPAKQQDQQPPPEGNPAPGAIPSPGQPPDNNPVPQEESAPGPGPLPSFFPNFGPPPPPSATQQPTQAPPPPPKFVNPFIFKPNIPPGTSTKPPAGKPTQKPATQKPPQQQPQQKLPKGSPQNNKLVTVKPPPGSNEGQGTQPKANGLPNKGTGSTVSLPQPPIPGSNPAAKVTGGVGNSDVTVHGNSNGGNGNGGQANAGQGSTNDLTTSSGQKESTQQPDNVRPATKPQNSSPTTSPQALPMPPQNQPPSTEPVAEPQPIACTASCQLQKIWQGFKDALSNAVKFADQYVPGPGAANAKPAPSPYGIIAQNLKVSLNTLKTQAAIGDANRTSEVGLDALKNAITAVAGIEALANQLVNAPGVDNSTKDKLSKLINDSKAKRLAVQEIVTQYDKSSAANGTFFPAVQRMMSELPSKAPAALAAGETLADAAIQAAQNPQPLHQEVPPPPPPPAPRAVGGAVPSVIAQPEILRTVTPGPPVNVVPPAQVSFGAPVTVLPPTQVPPPILRNPGSTLPPAATQPLRAGANGHIDPVAFEERAEYKIAHSALNGQAPASLRQFGITTGSPHEWARLFTMIQQQESGHRIAPVNPDGTLQRFSTTLAGEKSYGPGQFNIGEYGLNTWADVNNPDRVIDAYINVALQGKLFANFGSLQRPNETLQWGSWYAQNVAPNLPGGVDYGNAGPGAASCSYRGCGISQPSQNQLANLPSGLEKVAAADCASGSTGKPCAIDPTTGNAASCDATDGSCQQKLAQWAAQQRPCAAVPAACNGTVGTFTATPNGSAPGPYQFKDFNQSIQGANQKVSNVARNACAAVLGTDCDYTSGYRDPAHNAAVGGASGSQHIHGNAVDLKVPPAQAPAIVNALRAALCNYNGCNGGIGYYGVNPDTGMAGFHVDVRNGRSIWGPDHTSNSIINGPIGDQQRAFANGQAPSPLIGQQQTFTITDKSGNKVADNVTLPPGAAANCGSSCSVDFATDDSGKPITTAPITPLTLTQDPNDPNKFTAPDDRPPQPQVQAPPGGGQQRFVFTNGPVGTVTNPNPVYSGYCLVSTEPIIAQPCNNTPPPPPPPQPPTQPQQRPIVPPLAPVPQTVVPNSAATSSQKAVVTLVANPKTVAPGGTASLSWTSLGTIGCQVYLPSGQSIGSSQIAGTIKSPALTTSTVFTARCQQAASNNVLVATTSVTVK